MEGDDDPFELFERGSGTKNLRFVEAVRDGRTALPVERAADFRIYTPTQFFVSRRDDSDGPHLAVSYGYNHVKRRAIFTRSSWTAERLKEDLGSSDIPLGATLATPVILEQLVVELGPSLAAQLARALIEILKSSRPEVLEREGVNAALVGLEAVERQNPEK